MQAATAVEEFITERAQQLVASVRQKITTWGATRAASSRQQSITELRVYWQWPASACHTRLCASSSRALRADPGFVYALMLDSSGAASVWLAGQPGSVDESVVGGQVRLAVDERGTANHVSVSSLLIS